jgi:hypothetical protein
MYHVIDARSRKILGRWKSLTRAYDQADRLDTAYGAVRCLVIPA